MAWWVTEAGCDWPPCLQVSRIQTATAQTDTTTIMGSSREWSEGFNKKDWRNDGWDGGSQISHHHLHYLHIWGRQIPMRRQVSVRPCQCGQLQGLSVWNMWGFVSQRQREVMCNVWCIGRIDSVMYNALSVMRQWECNLNVQYLLVLSCNDSVKCDVNMALP